MILGMPDASVKQAAIKLFSRKPKSFTAAFPQVVGVRGVNLTQRQIIAHELYTHVPQPRQSPAAGQPSGGVSMVVAAGPFTTTEDLTYEPLQELLKYCMQQRPQQLLLAGPFVDAQHPDIEKGLVDRTFQQIFGDEVGCSGWAPAGCVKSCSYALAATLRFTAAFQVHAVSGSSH